MFFLFEQISLFFFREGKRTISWVFYVPFIQEYLSRAPLFTFAHKFVVELPGSVHLLIRWRGGWGLFLVRVGM